MDMITIPAGTLQDGDSIVADSTSPTGWRKVNASATTDQAPRSLGTGPTQACAGDDPRLADPRVPLPHAHSQSDVTGLVADLASKALASDLALRELAANKGLPLGYASLGADGKVPSSQLPASGSASITAAVVNFGTVALRTASVTVTDASVTAQSKVIVAQADGPDTDENGSDMDVLSFSARPAQGSFTLHASGTTPFLGAFRVVYQVG